MQADRVDGTMVTSVADNPWDEQDRYKLEKYKDHLLQLRKKLELRRKEVPLDDFDDHLEWTSSQQLQRLHQQEFLDSLQREWETAEGLNRLVMKQLEHMGNEPEPGYEKLPQEEIERLFKPEIELRIKDRLEHHMWRWAGYFQQSLGMQVQPLPNDLPAFWRQIERLRRQSLQNWQHELLSIERQVDKFSRVVDRSSVFSSIYELNSVRVQAQGSHTKMEDKIPGTVASVGSAEADESSALFLHQPFLLTNPGGEGSDVPQLNHYGPALASSTEANRVALVDQLTATQSQDKRETDHSDSSDMPVALFDTQAQVNCTGNFNVLSNLRIGPGNFAIVAANGGLMETFMSGSVRLANLELHDVNYCPDLGNRIIVSGSMLDTRDYGYEVGRGKLTVTDLRTDRIVGEGRLVNGNYIVDYLKITHDRTRVPELATRMWNAVCSALHRLGLKY